MLQLQLLLLLPPQLPKPGQALALTCLAKTGALNCFQYLPSAVSLIDLAGNCFTASF
jgi:hypothetical protein